MSEMSEMTGTNSTTGTRCKKDGWVKKKLGEVCEKIQNIQWTKKEDDEEYLYIDLTAVNKETNRIEQTEFVTKLNAPSRAKQIVRYNDVIFATTRPNLKRICIVPSEYDGSICSTGFCVLRAKEDILPSWIFYNLKSQSYYDYIKPLEKGVTYPAVSNSEVLQYKFKIPSVSDQQHIVSELDCLNGIIEKQKEQLKQLDELAQSIFYDMFGDPVDNEKGWDVFKLKSLCSKITDGTHNSPKSYPEGDFLYVTAKNIKTDGFDFTDISYVTADVHTPIYARCNPEFGDVLYIKDGATTGVAMINSLRKEFSLLSSVALIKVNNNILNNYYLKSLLNNQSKYSQIRNLMGGAAITRLTISKIKEIGIPVPPLSLQQAFARKIEAIEHQKELIKQSLAETENLFNSRMDYYFG